jgi:hypothetical protein
MSINEGSCQRLARPGGFDPRIRRSEDPYRRFLHHALVDDIFSQVPTEYKQKHTAPEYSENFVKCGIGVIFLIKNPYSWVLSMYNRPYGLLLPKPDNFSRFLRNPWLGLRRDNVPSVLSCPLELWNRKLASYCCFAEFAKRDGLPLLFLKFEEFVADQLEALSKIRFVFGVWFPRRLRGGHHCFDQRSQIGLELLSRVLLRRSVACGVFGQRPGILCDRHQLGPRGEIRVREDRDPNRRVT